MEEDLSQWEYKYFVDLTPASVTVGSRQRREERERGEPVWVVSCDGNETLICGMVAMVTTTTLSVQHWTELVPTSTTSDKLEHLLLI